MSSTGHLIIVSELLGFHDEKGKVFEIFIQAGAILAVCWEYRDRIGSTFAGLFSDKRAQRFAINLTIAFVPLAGLAFLFNKAIKAVLFTRCRWPWRLSWAVHHPFRGALVQKRDWGAPKAKRA